VRLSHLAHDDGAVYSCKGSGSRAGKSHTIRYYIIPLVGAGFPIAYSLLRQSSAADREKFPVNKRGRERNAPPGERALTRHERQVVVRATRTPAAQREGHRTATLARLRTWLTDPAMDAALTMICKNASVGRCVYFGCQFFEVLSRDGFETVRKWPRENGVMDIHADVDKLLAPINYRDEHWALTVVDFRARAINYIDSMLPTSKRDAAAKTRHVFDKMQGFLHAQWRHLGKEGDMDEFDTIVANAPRQRNQVDCGVFVLAFSEAICRGRSIAGVAQENITSVRRRIAATVELRTARV
jgi:hypothetical protein